MKIETILPWQAMSKDGYAKLDMQVVVDAEFGALIVRRCKPSETDAGQFVVFHNAERVSGIAHDSRTEALAEAERWFYSLPRFAASGQAKVLNVVIDSGEEFFRRGISVYKNPHPVSSVSHTQWLTGWLRGYSRSISEKFMATIEPTIRANRILEDDLAVATNRLQAYGVVLDYAQMIADADGDYVGVDNKGGPRDAILFIRDFRSGDVDLMSRKWPGWSKYLFDKRIGPAPEPDGLLKMTPEETADYNETVRLAGDPNA